MMFTICIMSEMSPLPVLRLQLLFPHSSEFLLGLLFSYLADYRIRPEG